MKDLIACCGLDCETCDARIATLNDDNELRKKTAKLWSELNGAEITAEMINCVGCRVDGVKTPFCNAMCPIRKCAASKKVNTCGDCDAMAKCETLGTVTANNAQALENLKNKMIKLVVPTIELKEKALQYRKEHFDNGESVINGSELLDKIDAYEEWLESVTKNADPKTVSKEWVLTDTFFAMNEEEEIIGIIDLRHTLNDFLIDFGNCGYSVRPSKRNKGYATEMLHQILDVARQAGLSEIHLSVEKSNIPSVKTIVKNGGYL